MAYDPADRVILIANDRDDPPFVPFISRANYSVLQMLSNTAPASTGGIEQSVWDGPAEKFFIAIPATKTNAKN